MTHSRLGNTSSTPAVRPGEARAPALAATQAVASWWVLLPAIGLTALLIYLAITPLPPFAADPYGSLTRRYGVLGVLVLGYVAWLIAQRRLPRRSVFDLPLAAVTLSVLLAVGRSIDPRLSLEHVLPLLPTLVLFYLLHDVRALDGRRLAWAALLAIAVVAVFALASVWRSLDDWWTLVRAVDGGLNGATLLPPSTPRVADVGNHPNVLGTALAMALPAALLLWTESADRRARAVVAMAALLIAAALFFTLSRAAWVGAGAGLCVTVTGYVVAGRGRIHLPRWVWVVLIAAALVVALAALWLLASGARPEWLFRDSLGPRADMRRAGWEMFRDNPLTGVGPGLYVALYPLYGGAYPFAAVHSHNIVVQTALDTGLFGLFAGGLLLVAVLVVVVRGLRSADRTSRRLTAAAAGMLAAGLVHALADSPQLFPEVQALGAVALVMLARSVETLPGVRLASLIPLRLPQWLSRAARVAGWSGPTLAVLLAVVLPVAWLVTSRAHLAHSESVALANEERWPEAVAAAERAVARDDRMAAYWFQLGAAHAAAAIDGERPAEQQAALDAFRQGLELEPHNGAALVNYAALGIALDRPEVAREALPALARLAGRDSLLLLAHATLTQWTAPPEQAINTYAGLLVINPSLGGTMFWRTDPFRAANFDRIVDRALARVPEVAGDGPAADSLRTAIRLYAGREAPSLESVQAALAARPEDVSLRVAAGRLLMESESTRPEAYDLLRDAVRIKGDDPSARAALGDWYARSGDVNRARREWTAAAYLGDLGAAISLGSSYPSGQVPAAVKRQAEDLLIGAEIGRFYLIFQTFRFTFQRAEPNPIILPGDWLLALPEDLERWRETVDGW